MKNQSLLLVPLLFMWLQWHAFAAENESPSVEMNSLVNSGQYQQAFDMGTANLEEWEGDPEFDFAYGLAALESGNPNEAVFALERVAATSTDGVLRERSRLELARAYFVTNNLTAAENSEKGHLAPFFCFYAWLILPKSQSPLFSFRLLEIERSRIDAVAQPGFRRAIGKYMAEMGIALGTGYLGTNHAMGVIGQLIDTALLCRRIETRPART